MNAKTIHRFVSIIMIVMSLLFSYTSTGSAQTAEGESQVTFSMLGYPDEVMHGPFTSFRIRFNAPTTWNLLPGAKLLLNINSSYSTPNGVVGTEGTVTGASMQVTFNESVLETIFLVSGLQTYEIAIPDAALLPQRLDGRHEVRIALDAGVDCLFERQTTAVVLSTSSILLPHELVSPVLDLARLPYPIYQPSSFTTESAVIIVGDQPSKDELKAAMTVAAGFGRMTGGLMPVTLVNASGLSDTIKSSNHVIAVGKPAGLPFLAEAAFAAPVGAASVNAPAGQPDDGILELAVSPWNPGQALLYVGGNSDAGVVKAAQALSFGAVRTGPEPSLAVISDVSSSVQIPSVAEDRSLASLGYDAQTVTGAGINVLEFDFYVPPGQAAGTNPYFELVYAHSALMDFNRSGVLVMLNGQPVGSLRFSEETARQVNTAQIALPDYAIRPGNNRLAVEVENIPLENCSTLSSAGLWMTVSPTSLIHLPLLPVVPGQFSVPQDLSSYPYPFIGHPSLAEMAIVIPADDPLAWDVAANIMRNLGQRATGTIISPEVVFADQVTEDIRQQYDLLLVGRATQLPLSVELGNWLPAPFSQGTDVADESGLAVTYRLPEGVDVGYVQYLAAPWNANRTIIGVFGSTPQGLRWAGNALYDPQLQNQLAGNFAVVNGLQVFTSDTRLGLGTNNLSATAVPGVSQPGSPELPLTTGPVQTGRPAWILPVIIFVTILTVAVLGYAIISSLRQNRGMTRRE